MGHTAAQCHHYLYLDSDGIADLDLVAGDAPFVHGDPYLSLAELAGSTGCRYAGIKSGR